jgi:hypothetical protein
MRHSAAGIKQPSVVSLARAILMALAAAAVLGIAGCAARPPAPAVPSLHHSSAAALSQADALHLAGQCMRQHGISGFPDPAVNAAGVVTFSKDQLRTAPQAVVSRAFAACRGALGRAGIQFGDKHALTSRQLRQLLAFAGCLRAHGLPGVHDPSPATGKVNLPPGVSQDSPVVLRAYQACRALLPGNG